MILSQANAQQRIYFMCFWVTGETVKPKGNPSKHIRLRAEKAIHPQIPNNPAQLMTFYHAGEL